MAQKCLFPSRELKGEIERPKKVVISSPSPNFYKKPGENRVSCLKVFFEHIFFSQIKLRLIQIALATSFPVK